MEKPDRDFTHAMRAEDEYRALIQEYPDSKLVPRAKTRGCGKCRSAGGSGIRDWAVFIFAAAYPAAIARLKTLVERYPLL